MLSIWGTFKTNLFWRLKTEILDNLGLVYQTPIFWSYNWGGRTKKNFANKVEVCLNYSKGSDFLFNADEVRIPRKMPINLRTGKKYETGTIPTNVWEYNLLTTSKEAKESNFHPTVKPQFILSRMIKAYSNPGDIVLDVFSGSGSTAITAITNGRNFIGCEKNETYYQKALDRIKLLGY
jgi:DNA modification methylase